MSGEPSKAVKPPVMVGIGNELSMPRLLGRNESSEDLKEWERSVQEFFRKDVNMYPFVSPGFCWDRSKENYNLLDEHKDSELERSAEEMAQDLDSFLQMMAGFIQDEFCRLRILQETGSYRDVIGIIKDLYKSGTALGEELTFSHLKQQPNHIFQLFYYT